MKPNTLREKRKKKMCVNNWFAVGKNILFKF